ncbi:hypothetical protein QTP88_005897 [Uroleucon formosanum]
MVLEARQVRRRKSKNEISLPTQSRVPAAEECVILFESDYRVHSKLLSFRPKSKVKLPVETTTVLRNLSKIILTPSHVVRRCRIPATTDKSVRNTTTMISTAFVTRHPWRTVRKQIGGGDTRYFIFACLLDRPVRERSASVGRGGGDGVYLSVVRIYLTIVVGPFVSVPRRRRCTVRPHDTQSVAIHRGPRPHHHFDLLSVLSTVLPITRVRRSTVVEDGDDDILNIMLVAGVSTILVCDLGERENKIEQTKRLIFKKMRTNTK